MSHQNSMVTKDQRLTGPKGKEASENDRFPVGMRVLVVEFGNSSREIVLKNLLRRCEYNVTTLNNAREALKTLRENRNRFDLVIIEVSIPDRTCFKLIELIDTELNISVVVVSSSSEHNLVRKAIELGACDYLLKPLRIEEIRNIWQHVLRKRYAHLIGKPAPSEATPDDQENQKQALANGNNSELYRILKDSNDDAEESDENESSWALKKRRIVWSMDLHKKFVQAVNQLGVEKAVPKRIQELMGVDDITRENIASHLQKYRMFLRRHEESSVEQMAQVPTFGGSPSYLHMTPSERTRASGGAEGLPSQTMPQLSPGVPFGSQLSEAPPSSSDFDGLGEPQPANPFRSTGKSPSIPALPASIRKPDLVQGNTSSNGPDLSRERTSARNLTIGAPNNSLPDVSNHLLESSMPIPCVANFGNQSNISGFQEPSSIGIGGSSLNNGSANENWQSSNQFHKFPSTPLPFNGDFSQNQPAQNHLTNEFASTNMISGDAHQNQSGFFANQAGNINFPGANQWNMNYSGTNADNGFGSFQSPMPAPYEDSSNQILGLGQYGMGAFNADFTNQFNTAPLSSQQHAVGNLNMEANMSANGGYVPMQQQAQDQYATNGPDSIDEILNAMMKRNPDASSYEDDFNFNMYNF